MFLSTVEHMTCILQEGIQPMWEDERNKLGGRWLVNLDKRKRGVELDRFWLETVSMMSAALPQWQTNSAIDGYSGNDNLCLDLSVDFTDTTFVL